MLENPMVSGYGFPKKEVAVKDYPVEDTLGTEILCGDTYYDIDGVIVLEENLERYLMEHMGAYKYYAE